MRRYWHEFWYAYHKRSAKLYHDRFFAGWGNKQDADTGDEHLRKAIYHRQQAGQL